MSWQAALERTVTGLGYDLVDVERSAGGLLRVTIDRLPGQAYVTGPGEHVLVEDCEVITRQLQYVLEVENLDYQRLEVSSPGVDRPLKKPADWQRFVGAEIELTLREPFQGRRRWRGVLMAAMPSSQAAGEGASSDGAAAAVALTPAASAAAEAGSAWRLVLTPDAPAAAKPGRAAGVKAAKGAKGAQLAAKAAAGPTKASARRAAGDAAPAPEMVLDFSLDEVREARLVPVLDFKGRRGAAAPSAADGVAEAHENDADGGQD